MRAAHPGFPPGAASNSRYASPAPIWSERVRAPLSLIEFPADDPERARRFWGGLLGVELEARREGEGEGWQTRPDSPAVGVHARAAGPETRSHCPTSSCPTWRPRWAGSRRWAGALFTQGSGGRSARTRRGARSGWRSPHDDQRTHAKALGEALNAADYMIVTSLALLSYRRDLSEGIEARPAGRLVDRVLPLPAT